ncbi:lysine--tRNA ligase [Candidatus Woesebacteria bacterium]|nr:lysine--tRNA ligase [Candidatus Woesebacteria bacterium]
MYNYKQISKQAKRTAGMSRMDETISAKKEKRTQLEKLNILVHPYSFDKKQTISDARSMMEKQVKTAGRIMSIRAHGKVVFMDLQDSMSSIQVMVRQSDVSEEKFSWLKTLVDRGDFLGVSGEVTTTKTGEITIVATEFELLSKSLRPLPTEWNTAENKETRFRKRYLDMLINPESKRILDARWLIEKEIRRFLQDKHAFVEVETPILQPLYGGTNATPFSTHMNALDTDFYLRIAPELYLKRLIVGGYDKVFEIARNFRNEGIDQTHQPEFTMIEWYETYADYHRMMDVAENLVKHLVEKLYGELKIKVGEKEIDISENWQRLRMDEALKKYVNIDFNSLDDQAIKDLLDKNNIKLKTSFTRGKALFEIFDALVTPLLINPIWIIDYPRDISPLAKQHRKNPELAERFEAYIGGKELADGWSEIVDSIDQRNIFENEQKNLRQGDTEAHPLDEDFLEAMEHGMPPLGGIGMGIDRLVMFLTNTWSIKEVIAFPTLKPVTPIQVRKTENQTEIKSEKNAGADSEMQTNAQAEKQAKPETKSDESIKLPSREESLELLGKYIKDKSLFNHCEMVALAMQEYAKSLGENEDLWYATGLLHDLDWEMFPDEHPNKALADLLGEYPQTMLDAIAAHAPSRTGKSPATTLEKYLFACDEISGFMNAVSILRPTGFEGMKTKSINKKLKTKAFAANVSREDIEEGLKLINKSADEHFTFLIKIFSNNKEN